MVSIDTVLRMRVSSISNFFSERKDRSLWYFVPHTSYRLTEQDITDFVNCVKDYAFISIFNKKHINEAAEACQYLSMLRPELIVPPIIEKSDTFVSRSLNVDSFVDSFRRLTV